MARCFFIFIVSLLLCACSHTSVGSGTAPAEHNEKTLTNLQAEADYGKVKLTWALHKPSDVQEILLTYRERGLVVKKVLPADATEYIVENHALKPQLFSLKLILKSGKQSPYAKVYGQSKQRVLVLKEEDYIDIDANTLKFLFKTNIGAKLKFYLAEASNELTLYKEINEYDYRDGLKISGLTAGKTYQYKIVSEFNGLRAESPIISFTKLDRKPYNKTASWAKTAIFYEVFVRAFFDGDGDGIGDFQGLAEKLDYLKDLGVDALWLMPSFESPSYHGYDVVNYYNVNPQYGSLEQFKHLLQEAKKREMKIIIDLVINHVGKAHPWFQQAQEEGSEYRDYFVWADQFDDLAERGPWGQQLWYANGRSDNYMAIFWSGMPDLNLRNARLRAEIKEVAKFWLELGVDGFRLDASKHIDDKDTEVTHNWWQEFNEAVKQINPNAYLVGENWDENLEVIAPYLKDMDSSFNFALSSMITQVINGRSQGNILQKLLSMHEAYRRYSPDFIDSTFIRNHDMNRVSSDLHEDPEKAKLAASMLLTLPGTPFLYYGEELGQLGIKPDDNIREPFDWYKSAQGMGMTDMSKSNYYNSMKFTHANDGISLEEQLNDTSSLYQHYKKLLQLRKQHEAFFYGDYKSINLGKKLLAYSVDGDEKEVIVVHNLSNNENRVDLSEYFSEQSAELLNNLSLANGQIKLQAYQSLIIQK